MIDAVAMCRKTRNGMCDEPRRVVLPAQCRHNLATQPPRPAFGPDLAPMHLAVATAAAPQTKSSARASSVAFVD
jgi:hypothetical protein